MNMKNLKSSLTTIVSLGFPAIVVIAAYTIPTLTIISCMRPDSAPMNNSSPAANPTIELWLGENKNFVFKQITNQPSAVIVRGDITEYHWMAPTDEFYVQGDGARELDFKNDQLVGYKNLWDNVTVRPSL
jgi:hypothetical protein